VLATAGSVPNNNAIGIAVAAARCRILLICFLDLIAKNVFAISIFII
jgi:hypothetical protein